MLILYFNCFIYVFLKDDLDLKKKRLFTNAENPNKNFKQCVIIL